MKELAKLIGLPDPELGHSSIRYGFPIFGTDREKHYAEIVVEGISLYGKIVDDLLIPSYYRRYLLGVTERKQECAQQFLRDYNTMICPRVDYGHYFLAHLALVDDRNRLLDLFVKLYAETYEEDYQPKVLRIASSILIQKGVERQVVFDTIDRMKRNIQAAMELVL